MESEIRAYIEARRLEVAEDIRRLIAIRSVSSDRAGARAALAAFLGMAEAVGMTTRLRAGGDVGVAEIGPDGPFGVEAETLGILAHVDVVEPGDESAWSRSPWGEIADGAVWGRGALDDKGPLVLCLWAVRALRELGLPFRKRVRFIVGTMEEVDWEDMRAYLAEEAPPDYGFTPDGEFPVINREKGHCDVVLRFAGADRRRLGPYSVETVDAGVAANAVPDLARAVLAGEGALIAVRAALDAADRALRDAVSVVGLGAPDRVELVARGLAVHSSVPERGDNALVRLCVFLKRLGANPFVDFVADVFSGDFLATGLGLQTRPETALGEYIGPTTASPDLARTEADAFLLTVNLRCAYGQTEDEARAAFASAEGRYGYSIETEGFLPALFISKDEPFMRALHRAYERGTGLPGEFILAPGTSYAKAMPHVAAFGPIVPGSPDLCHEVDERLSFADLEACFVVYALAISDIAGAEESLRA